MITQLPSWNDGAVEKYLQQLSNYYQHCHIHAILYDDEASMSNMENPHVLTQPVPFEVNPDPFKSRVGGWAIPSFKHMIGRCQATFEMLLKTEALPDERYAYSQARAQK